MTMPLPFRLVALLIAAMLAASCAWRAPREDYRSAEQTPPLEVPPPLTPPAWREAVRVPEPGAPAGRASASTASAAVGLRLEDSPDHAFRRVRTALDRAGEVTVVGDREEERVVEVEVLTVREPSGNFLRRWFGRSRVERERLFVRITPEGDRAVRITLYDASGRAASGEAARRVLAVLRQRLG
jgi:uncharacterized lipoprotein